MITAFNFKIICIALVLSCMATSAWTANSSGNKLIGQALSKYEELETFNKANDRAGRPDLNKYVIELNPNWIEEKPTRIYTHSYYDDLSKRLIDFNTTRTDKLRVYVLVVNDFYGQLKENINLKDIPPGEIKFGKYVDGSNELYKKFLSDIGSLPAEISKALLEKGYEDRIVYFCGIIQLYKTPKDRAFYLHTNLTAEGPKLKFKRYDLAERVKLSWQMEDKTTTPEKLETIQEKILKGVHNLLDAVEMVIDKNLPNGKRDPRCTMASLEGVAEFTKTTKELEFNIKVSACGTLIRNPTAKQQLGSRYVIVENPSHFKRDVFFHEKLPDKVKMISEKGLSDYKLYVVYKEVNFAMAPAEWPMFAKEVYSQSNLKGNDILITVPYYITTCTFPNGGGGQSTQKDKLLMPGAYCANNHLVAGDINAAFPSLALETSNTYVEKRWESIFNQAFKKIPKDRKIIVWSVLWNGDAIFNEAVQESYKGVTGYEDIISLRIIQDTRLDEVYQAYTKRNCSAEGLIYGTHESPNDAERAFERMAVCESAYDGDVENILSKPPNFQVFEGTAELIQSSLNKEVSLQFVLNFVSKKSINKCKKISESLFYGNNSPFKGAGIFLTLVDLGSLAASPFGMDWVFDGVGLIYSLSKGDAGNAIMYEISLAAPFLTAPVLRGMVAGKNLLVKGAKGAYLIPRKLYGLTFLIKEQGGFSHLASSILRPKSLNKAKVFVNEKSFVEALEDGLLAEPKAAQAFNDSPDLIDEFNAFHKAGKGDMGAFLASKRIVLGLEEEILKAVSLIKKEANWVDVVVHGDANSFTVWHNGVKVKLDHRRLLSYMESKGYTKGTNIRLLSCETGRSSLAIAQFLADKAKATVKAPNVNIGVTEAGDVVSLGGIQGEWMHFKPNQSTPFGATSPEKIPTIIANEKAYKLGGFDEQVVDLLAISKALDDPAFTALSKYKDDDKFLSAFEGILKNNGDKVTKEINDYPDLIEDLYKQFNNSGKNVNAFVSQVADARKSIDILEKNVTFINIRKQYLSKETPRLHADKLTLEEEASIRFYTITGVQDINPALRGEQAATVFHKEIEKTINNGLNKLPMENDIVYRGIAGAGERQFAQSLTQGKVFNFKDFKSTSINRAVAITYTSADNGYIYVIKSKTGRNIKNISPLQGESEVLFKSGSQFKVTKVQTAANPPYVKEIHLEEVSSAVDDAILAGLENLVKNLDAPVAQAVRQFAISNPDPYMRQMIEDAIKKNELDELKSLVGLKSVPENQLIGASGKSYADDIVIDPEKKAEDLTNKLKYLNETERAAWEVKVKNGKIMINNQAIEEGPLESYMYVLASNGKIYASPNYGGPPFRHSSFLAGGNVGSAGLINIDEGILYINNLSGHYLPSPATLTRIIRELTSRGVDGKLIRVRPYVGPGG